MVTLVRVRLHVAEPRQEVEFGVVASPSIDLGKTEEESGVVLGGRAGHVPGADGGGEKGSGAGVSEAGGFLVIPSFHLSLSFFSSLDDPSHSHLLIHSLQHPSS